MSGTKTHAACTIPKTECDYLYGWIKKKTKQPVTCAKISPTMVNPREITGNADEEE